MTTTTFADIDEGGPAAQISLAEQSAASGDHGAARRHYQAALDRLGPESALRVRALAGYGWALRALDALPPPLAQPRHPLPAQTRLDPDNGAAIAVIRRGIGEVLMALGRFDEALAEYRAVLAAATSDEARVTALNLAGEAAARAGLFMTARGLQREAVDLLRRLRPPGALETAIALTNLGVSLFELDLPDEADAALREALDIDPNLLLAAENLIYVLSKLERKAEARALAETTYGRQSFIVRRQPDAVGTLLTLRSLEGNIPHDHLLARLPLDMIAWHIEFADAAHEARLPAYDVVLNLIGDADRGRIALEHAARFATRCATPLLNDPRRVQQTQRHQVAERLAGVANLVIPRVIQTSFAQVRDNPEAVLATHGLRFPILLRSAGKHGGDGVARVDTPAALAEAAGDFDPAADAYLTEYHDYASADGYYRKYRVIFIDRMPLPYHLAISSNWLVHYFSADMATSSEKLEEELHFLADMDAVLGPVAMAALGEIGRRQDLDYCGVDFALLPDGQVLLFESNATMLVHPEAQDGVLARKNPYIGRIFSAFEAMIMRERAQSSPREAGSRS